MQNADPITARAAGLRKYFYESVLIALASAVVSLSLMYNSLNNYIRQDLTKMNVEQTRVIDRNTDALNVLIIHQSQQNNR